MTELKSTAAQAGKIVMGFLTNLLDKLDKYQFLPMSEFRKKNMRDKQQIFLELEKIQADHARIKAIEDAKTRATIALMEGNSKLALDAAEKDIADGMSYQEAFTKNLPDAVRATHVLYMETLDKQHARDCVSLYAIAEAADNPDAPIEDTGSKTSDTWFTRFWSYAEQMRDEELQERWGKVLAGEIRRPGSVSLKALDILYSLDTRDAVNFEKIAPYVLNDDFILDECFKQEKISYLETATLESIGLIIRQTIKQFTGVFLAVNASSKMVIKGLDITGATPILGFHCCLLTPAGRELLRLITVSEDRYQSAMDFVLQAVRKQHPQLKVSISKAE